MTRERGKKKKNKAQEKTILFNNFFFLKGFLEQTRRRSEMFPASRIQRIFGNLEAICALHCKFLRELELTFDSKMPENSCIGNVFLRNVCYNNTEV